MIRPSIRTVVLALTCTLIVTLLAAVAMNPASAARAAKAKCYGIRSPGESQSHLECYSVAGRYSNIYKVGYRDSLVNRTNRTAYLDCTAEHSKTFTMSASVTVSAEIKAGIFASVKAEATASVSKSMSSGYAVKANISVPAKTTTYCDRVVYHERFKIKKCYQYPGMTSPGSCKYFTFTAPSRPGWRLSDSH